MLTLTRRLAPNPNAPATFSLSLTADDRTRSRHRFETSDGQPIYLRLPRGTVLRHGDLLAPDAGPEQVRIVAKPEPVMTVTAEQPLDLLRAAYHLGNRHVPLEITTTYLRLSPDPVLRDLLAQMGLQVTDDLLPFQPETGAYSHSHDSTADHPATVHVHSAHHHDH